MIADWRHYVPIYPLVLLLALQLVLLARTPRWLNAILLALFVLSGAPSIARTGDGLLWNQPAWRNNDLVARLPELIRTEGALIHSNEPSYLLLRLGLDSTVRMFGGDAGFRDYTCDDLTYPDGFTHAVFVVIDMPFLRDTPPDAAADFYRAWAEPCGTVESMVNDSMAAITTVRLNGR